MPGSGVDAHSVRVVERASIREFVESCRDLLARGRVLDYGCGNNPYRDLVGGEYVGFDRESFPANVSGADVGPAHDPLFEGGSWDAILCTQVIQYMPSPGIFVECLEEALVDGGWLVLTGPTAWAEVEPDDLHRFTLNGITRLLEASRFVVERAERRAVISMGGFDVSLGYGIVARA